MFKENNLNLPIPKQGKLSSVCKTVSDIISNDSSENMQKFSKECLLQKIQKQGNQIQQLLSMIAQYKIKIKQFSKYEDMIHKLQNNENNSSINQTPSQFFTLCKSFHLKIEPQKKQMSLFVHSNYNLTLYSETLSSKTDLHNNLSPLQPLKNQCSDSFSNINFCNNFTEDQTLKKCQRSYTAIKNMRLKSVYEHKTMHDHPGQINDENYINFIQRVPSLDNLRRIKHCFKMLKS